MNIFFTASVLQQEQYGQYYLVIISILEKMGHKIVHAHVTQTDMDKIAKVTHEENSNYYKRVQKWISDADLVFAEVSFPSTLNIGHQITLALEKNKPVISLYHSGKSSAFFEGIRSERLIYQEYTAETLEQVVRESMEYIEQNSDTRFNFIVPRRILDYLDWVALHKNLPRSVYLRTLIEQDMKKSKEYSE